MRWTFALWLWPALSSCAPAQVVSWEGEAAEHNFREHSWVEMGPPERTGLSGGDWLTMQLRDSDPAPAEGLYFATWQVDVPAPSRYHLWVREWPRSRTLPCRWRFDDQPWRDASPDYPTTNAIELAGNRVAAWTRFGVVELGAGQHTFRVEVPADARGITAFDVFVLYRGEFTPQGKELPRTDAATFFDYPAAQQVEAMVKKAEDDRARAAAIRQEAAASQLTAVGFEQVGREVDIFRIGEKFADEYAAHRPEGRLGMAASHATFGRGQQVEWDFTPPSAGDYILTIAANICRLPDRTAKVSVQLGGQWQDLGILIDAGQFFCKVTLPAGPTRFRLANHGGGLFYSSGARLSTVRADPWTGTKPGKHPRLQFTAEEIAAIQKVYEAHPDHPVRYAYDGLMKAATDQVARPASLNGPRPSAQALHEVAIAYALTGRQDFGDRGADYLQRLSERDFGRNPGSVLGNGEYLDAVAWGYDALYPHLDDGLRAAVRVRLDTEAHWLWVQATALAKDTETYWWSSDHSNNWQAVSAGGLGMAALALRGESNDAALWLDEAVKQQRLLLAGGFDDDGAYFESPMYQSYATEYLTAFASALKREGLADLFAERGEAIRGSALYSLFLMEPTRDLYAAFNDGHRLAGNPPNFIHPCAGYLPRLADVYQDGLIRWLFDAMYGPGRRYPVYNYRHGYPDAVVYYKLDTPLEDPDTSPRIDTARVWPDHGRAVLRTGWNDPDGVLFAMECGAYGSHGHADQGGFVLSAFGNHLVDDAGYGGWEATSEAHSVPLIDGQGQKTGGQLGEIRDFIHTPAIDTYLADMAPAYGAARMDRHVIWLRPGAFVLVDELQKDEQPHAWRWLLHSQVDPPVAEIQVASPRAARIQCSAAALEVRLFGGAEVRSQAVDKNRHKFLQVDATQPAARSVWFALLQPLAQGQAMPAVTDLTAGELTGFAMGGDRVLWHEGDGGWQSGGLATDARLAAAREEPVAVMVRGATTVRWQALGLTADQPLTAVLTPSEARLVLTAPTQVTLAEGYLRGARIVATDQDRDPGNDRLLGTVDDGGRASLPVGAVTLRR